MRRTKGKFTFLGPLRVPTLLLTASGRKSGEPRKIVLTYMREGDRLFVVATNSGVAKHPASSLNLLANPDGWVTIKVTGDEYERRWTVFSGYSRVYPAYRGRTDRELRMFALTRRWRGPPPASRGWRSLRRRQLSWRQSVRDVFARQGVGLEPPLAALKWTGCWFGTARTHRNMKDALWTKRCSRRGPPGWQRPASSGDTAAGLVAAELVEVNASFPVERRAAKLPLRVRRSLQTSPKGSPQVGATDCRGDHDVTWAGSERDCYERATGLPGGDPCR